MNQSDIDTILTYLERRSTTHALLIKGRWGSGKTYAWKNRISTEVISKTTTASSTASNPKYYKPVYVSLYGIDSLDDLRSEVLLEMLPYDANKGIARIGGFVLGKTAQFFGIDLKTPAIEGAEIAGLIKFDSHVLAFDNLERVRPDLFVEVLGFINVLAETHGAKVIILADEERLAIAAGDGSSRWHVVKEKIVFDEIALSPNIPEVLRSVVEGNFNGETKKFFLDNAEIAVKAMERSGTQNFRSLLFGLYRFERLHSEYLKNKATYERLSSFLPGLLYFALALSFEFRSGALPPEGGRLASALKPDAIRQMHLARLIGDRNQQVVEPTPEETFYRKYFESQQVLVTTEGYTVYILDGRLSDGLLADIQFILAPSRSKNNNVELIERIRYRFLNVRPKEDFDSDIRELLRMTEAGVLQPFEYYGVAALLCEVADEGSYRIKRSVVEKMIRKGCSRSRSTGKYTYEPLANHLFSDASKDAFLVTLAADLRHWNEALREDEENLRLADAIKEMRKGNDMRLLDEIVSKSDNVVRYNRAMFKGANPRVLAAILSSSSVTSVAHFIQRVRERIDYSSVTEEEKGGLLFLLRELDNASGRRNNYDSSVIRASLQPFRSLLDSTQ